MEHVLKACCDGSDALDVAMIVPVRCFTCGKVLADKWAYYVRETERRQRMNAHARTVETDTDNGDSRGTANRLRHFDDLGAKAVLDHLGLSRACCRSHMLSTVDVSDTI
jgi:DNA-directed RNA polymerase subunit N (RpoN/RPB10)